MGYRGVLFDKMDVRLAFFESVRDLCATSCACVNKRGKSSRKQVVCDSYKR